MLDCSWIIPALMRKPPSTSCEVWVFNVKFPGIGLKNSSKAGPEATRSSTVGVRNARAARPNTENTSFNRCSKPTCTAYCVSLLSRGLAPISKAPGAVGSTDFSYGARAQAGVLSPPAIGEIGRRQQADGLLPVAGKRLLRQVVDVDWREAIELAAIGVVGRVVIVDPRQDV